MAIHPQTGKPIPIMDGTDENITDNVKLFDTRKQAVEMANDQILCKAGGYEIIRWDYLHD